MENSNEVFLRVTNHTGQAEKNLLGLAGSSKPKVAGSNLLPYLDNSLHTLRFNYYGTVNSGGE